MNRTLKCAFFLLVGVPVAFGASFLVANSVDESAQPEVTKALAWEAPAHGLENNGYLILRGIDAPDDADAAQVGRRMVESDLALFRSGLRKSPPPVEKNTANGIARRKQWQCKYSETANCLAYYLTLDRARTQALFSAEKTLLERYRAMRASESFVEMLPPRDDFDWPPFFNLTIASELERLRAIEAIADGRMDEGLAGFVENARYARTLLKSSTTLIAHMIAVSMVQRDTRILGELVEKYPRIAEQRELLAPILATVAAEEYSIGHAVDFEIAFQLRKIEDIPGEKGSLMLKKKATENLVYRLLKAQLTAVNAGAARYEQARASYVDERKTLLGWEMCCHVYFYNPFGKDLADIPQFSLADYAERQFDLNGDIGVVALQAKLIADRVPAAQIADAVRNAAEPMRNPYDGSPLVWDAASGTLSFQGRHASNLIAGKGKIFTVHLIGSLADAGRA